MNEHEIIKYHRSKKGSIKLLKYGDGYNVIIKKYILGFTISKKSLEFASFEEAEDKFLEIKGNEFYRINI